jgi:nucleoside-diphosphate-sugar epimerase
VVHTAARVHVMEGGEFDPLTEYQRVNVQGTRRLAKQAVTAGVKRFVFISSIKVNGEITPPDQSFSSEGGATPQDPYGISKLEAELALYEIAKETDMEVVIIRPPLVYGPKVRANFQALMRVVGRGVPLPLGSINNRRSLVGLDNLVDFILICVKHPAAANQTFLVSDGEDMSTAELVRRMARAMGRPARLFPVPVWLLQLVAARLGKREVVQRLCSNLQVDISKARSLLGWEPPVSVDEGLRRATSEWRV